MLLVYCFGLHVLNLASCIARFINSFAQTGHCAFAFLFGAACWCLLVECELSMVSLVYRLDVPSRASRMCACNMLLAYFVDEVLVGMMIEMTVETKKAPSCLSLY